LVPSYSKAGILREIHPHSWYLPSNLAHHKIFAKTNPSTHTVLCTSKIAAVKVLVEKSSGLKLSDVEVDPPPAQGNSSILLDDV